MTMNWIDLRRMVTGPYAATFGALALTTLLLTSISLTLREYGWTEFLFGILAAAAVASVSRAANAAWIIARRTSQLSSARAKLADEIRRRERAEKALARAGANVSFVDDALPAMLAYMDAGGFVRYHNSAYARWVGIGSKSVDGRRVQELVGPRTYADIADQLKAALEGREVRYERTQTMANGQTYRLFVHYIPHFDDQGLVIGLFAVLTDITLADDLPMSPLTSQKEAAEADCEAAGRLMSALDHDEFCLFRQEIASLGHDDRTPFYEVQLRQKEEEENRMPPGAFLALAEEHGMLPDLDKWVVRHVLQWAKAAGEEKQAVYVVNVSGKTLADPDFRQFVRAQLSASRLPGSVLCFESAETDVLASPEIYSAFISELGECGCQFVVSGIGRRATSFQLLQKLRVNYLKLDSGIILNMLRSRADFAMVKAINEAAHSAGIRTVAVCVDNELTRAALQGLDIDYAQGFGMSKPQLLGDPEPASNLSAVLPR